MIIGTKIRELRLKYGLTQQKLSELCGIDASTIRHYEANRLSPKIETAAKIAAALGVPVTELTGAVVELVGKYYPGGITTAETEGFIDYLNALGYIVADGDDFGQLELIHNGKSTPMSYAEFEQFERRMQDFVAFEIWQKQRSKDAGDCRPPRRPESPNT